MHNTNNPLDNDESSNDETFVRRLGDSALQIWLAGLGAFTKAQAEGTRLFDSLVSEGRQYESRARNTPSDSNDFKENVESALGQAREKGQRTWTKVEKAFDDQVQSVLKRLNVPSQDDTAQLTHEIQALRRRIGELEAQLNRHQTRCDSSPGQVSPQTNQTNPAP